MALHLNWREIERLVAEIAPEITGLFVDRVIVPERKDHPDGYQKAEWVVRLHSRTQDAAFVFSVAPRKPYFDWIPGKGPRAAERATRAGFDLALNKQLQGKRVLGFEAVPRERTVILWCDNRGETNGEPRSSGPVRIGLAIALIPALPEAFGIEDLGTGTPYRLFARSRNQPLDEGYTPPDGSRSPDNLTVREEIAGSLAVWSKSLRAELASETLALRKQRLSSKLTQDLKQAETRIKQNQTALREAEKEPDYSHFGDLLKGALANPPPLEGKIRRVMDWASGSEVELTCDPKLSPTEQVKKFYAFAKRKARRVEEARNRLDTITQKRDQLRRDLDALAQAQLPDLPALESAYGLSTGPGARNAEKRAAAGWDGKTFFSREGLPILVGRSKDENLELTFKFARGNDLWMHVRGRPGAHVVIPLREKKSASLETLLDAAVLCVYYSGGESWGKTEVDYTHKKHVKRIKDSTEASYTHNKTLLVEPEKTRLARLLGDKS